jgi:hypothetical protein
VAVGVVAVSVVAVGVVAIDVMAVGGVARVRGPAGGQVVVLVQRRLLLR